MLLATLLGLRPSGVEVAAQTEADSDDPRRRLYLEQTLVQLHRLQRALDGRVGPNREAAGALAAAALAAVGSDTGAEAKRLAGAAAAACGGRWHTVDCARAQLTLQHLVLAFPRVLEGEDLLPRLRRELSSSAPPPLPAEIADPWGFRETENQRMVKVARSLAAEVVAGRPASDAARAWGAYAEAFLGARERDGWYEADSPGYLPISMHGLLLLADHAPAAATRRLAARQLDLLFAAWAQKQVGGYPAGAKTRAYGHWALTTGNVPWPAWFWLLTGEGDPRRQNLRDWPELAAARYRVPEAVRRLLRARRAQPPYEILERRRFRPARRMDVDAALRTWATPDYILSSEQSVAGLRLRISGGESIAAGLLSEGPEFAPLYLWSRTVNPRGKPQPRKLRQAPGEDLVVSWRNVVLGRLGAGNGGGHVYLAPPWGEPLVEGDRAVARYGDTYVGLLTVGGWEAAPARQRFPEYYLDPRYRAARVLVPVRQPAAVALVVGRQAEDGSFEAFRQRLARASLTLDEGALRFSLPEGPPLLFVPGQRASVAGEVLAPEGYPLLSGPFLAREPAGWRFRFAGQDLRRSVEGGDAPEGAGAAPHGPPEAFRDRGPLVP